MRVELVKAAQFMAGAYLTAFENASGTWHYPRMKPYKGTVETLGHMKLTGHVFWGHCAAPNCSRGRKLDMDKLIAIYGEDFDYVEGGDAICAAFVCDRCRHKGGRLTMDGQSSYAKAKGV